MSTSNLEEHEGSAGRNKSRDFIEHDDSKEMDIVLEKSVNQIDRTKTCPFLLRCFWKLNQNNIPSDYRHVSKGIYPNQEVQIYTWLNATLREISDLLNDVITPVRDKSVSLLFSVVYVDNNGFFAIRRIGQVSGSKVGNDDNKTLAASNFEIGDFLDIAVVQPFSSNTTGSSKGAGPGNNTPNPRGNLHNSFASNNSNRQNQRNYRNEYRGNDGSRLQR